MTSLNKTDRDDLLDQLEAEINTYFSQQVVRLQKEASFLKLVKGSQTLDAAVLRSANYDRVKAITLFRALS